MQAGSPVTEIRAHVEQCDYAAAQDLCLTWRIAAPDNPDALHVSGEIALLVGDTAGAVTHFLKADSIRPVWATKLYLAYAHLLRKDYAAAESVCRAAACLPALSKLEASNTQEMLKDISMVRHLISLPAAASREGPRDDWEQAASAAMATLAPT